MKQRTTTIAGTAVLGALVLVFDYALKFSGLKIPFPWFPSLKFDFTGIPIVLSLYMYGLYSGATTSSIAFLAILLRSGDLIGASMKAIAEFSTILGMAPFISKSSRIGKSMSIILGLIFRVVAMSLFNSAVLPIFYSAYYPTFIAVILFLPLLGAFNIVAGSISIFGGFLIREALVKRIPSIMRTEKNVR
jgi:riboflavin transporter FmnP